MFADLALWTDYTESDTLRSDQHNCSSVSSSGSPMTPQVLIVLPPSLPLQLRTERLRSSMARNSSDTVQTGAISHRCLAPPLSHITKCRRRSNVTWCRSGTWPFHHRRDCNCIIHVAS